MKGKNFLSLIKLSLLIAVILAISACRTIPEPVHITYDRPAVPAEPLLIWSDIPGYYGLDDRKPYFDDLLTFWDEYDGYLTKIENLLKLYETNPQER